MKRRYSDLFEAKVQSLEVGPAKRGSKVERDQAKELHDLLRNYTYQLIGLGNIFRRVARDFSAKDGSNWRHNRAMSAQIKTLADQLYSMDPYDVDAILKIERELEKIALELSNGGAK